ncbi:MAG: hypothetical protein K0Q51_1103 [Rickettsiaceae bacterium]|jgi:hypothetical protein|nr:hypothetical protein [Rickettsiaceae bacterium]
MKSKFIDIPSYIKEEEIKSEVSKYSITPSTFQPRRFVPFEQPKLEILNFQQQSRLEFLNDKRKQLESSLTNFKENLEKLRPLIRDGEIKGFFSEIGPKLELFEARLIDRAHITQSYNNLLEKYETFIEHHPHLCLSFIEEYSEIS